MMYVLYYFLQDVEELIGLAPEKVLLKWMNFHLKKAGYKKTVSNFSSDLKVCKRYKLDLLFILISGLYCIYFRYIS